MAMLDAGVQANTVVGEGHAVQEGPQVELGGNERYVSVSRAEYKKIARGEGRIDPLQPPLPFTVE